MQARALESEAYFIQAEPYYEATGDEIKIFEAAYRNKLPILLKGPTGCGKTRFMEYMAWRLQRPLITVSCHDDLTASDLVGRYLVKGGETTWVDGPLTRAVRAGAICYLDEIVEARKDTMVVIRPWPTTAAYYPWKSSAPGTSPRAASPSRTIRLPKRAERPETIHANATSHLIRLPPLGWKQNCR